MTFHFLLGFGLSFIGSLPFGMINMTVAHTALRKGMVRAMWMAVGASWVEFFQVFIALKFAGLFMEGSMVERIFQAVAAAVFLGGAIYFFFFAKPHVPTETEKQVLSRRRHEFLKGTLLSTLNVMALPYWVFYGAVLSANNLLNKENAYVAIFSAGTVLGTFVLLYFYSLLGAKILRKSSLVTKWVNKFIGLVLAGFGLYELWQAIF
jgi:threonine/homoserine/homoserine lactone efflux protein